MRGLKDKNVLVTGASSGIGQAIAIRFAEEGANVAIHYNQGVDGARETKQRILDAGFEGKLLLVQADVAQQAHVERMFETALLELGGIDILINNAGSQLSGPGATITPMNDAWIDDAEKRAIVESHIPMGRSGTSEEMAAVTAFLCSDDASYITGQTLFVDGGITLFPEFGTSWASK